MDGVELELKAGLAAADLRRLRRLLAARGAAPERGHLVVTRYLDTADGRLASAGLAVRLRSLGGRHLLSVKSARTTVGGFQQARETELPLRHPRFDLASLPPGLATAIAGHAGDAPLETRFETRVRRAEVALEALHGRVRLALDEGEIRAGALSEPISEAEFELAEGSPEAVFASAEALLASLPARLDLPSKAARGEALARGAPLAVGPLARRPEPPAPGTSARDAFERLLAALASTIARNLHATLVSEEPEGPHQLRVALRRLRVALRLFRPILDPAEARALAETARDLGRLVSPLRDADVLVPQILALAEEEGQASLAEALRASHAATRAAVRRRLLAARATGFAIRLLRLAALGGWQRPGARERLSLPFEAVVAPGLDRLWKDVRHRGNRLAVLDPEERHELRKDLKKLRYGTELAGDRASARPFLAALKRLQEDLGEINDLAVLEAFAPDLPPDQQAAFRALKARLGKAGKGRADTLLGRACRHWRALAATDPWWRADALQPLPALAEPSP
ncbi:CHAD domain-containing protein [Thermaurantiacus tibetensis]|uniref:CYTH and CHAD domain-containing protein n=1 Tax=Thermaurantiacus tibetensis TaxID=2759035 RepID=UPI001890AC3F|nr:CHAD domain-containing protein [Thermaurantiacus tibetensis]